MKNAEKAKQVIENASAVMPAAPLELTPEEVVFYGLVMASIPPDSRRSPACRSLAASAAQCMGEIEQCSKVLRAEGLTVQNPQGVKAHPCVQIRDAAQKRLAALLSRLKALGTADQREVARSIRFESQVRGEAAPLVAGANAPRGGVDWVRVLAEQNAGAKPAKKAPADG
jgi:hypothetical protein